MKPLASSAVVRRLFAASTLAQLPLGMFGIALFAAGGAIAPTQATAYQIAGEIAVQSTITEAFAWLEGSIALGTAAGSAVAGVAVDAAGATTAFAIAAAAGALATLTAMARWITLAPGRGRVGVRDNSSGGAPCRSVF